MRRELHDRKIVAPNDRYRSGNSAKREESFWMDFCVDIHGHSPKPAEGENEHHCTKW